MDCLKTQTPFKAFGNGTVGNEKQAAGGRYDFLQKGRR